MDPKLLRAIELAKEQFERMPALPSSSETLDMMSNSFEVRISTTITQLLADVDPMTLSKL